MSTSKSVAVGIVAFVLGAAGARLSSDAVALRAQTPPITATATADAVTFHSNVSDRFLIVGMTDQSGAAATFAREVTEAKVPRIGTQPILLYQISARWVFQNGGLVACKPTEDCPVPPPPPPLQVIRVVEIKAPPAKVENPRSER